jgi:hypothetical protein
VVGTVEEMPGDNEVLSGPGAELQVVVGVVEEVEEVPVDPEIEPQVIVGEVEEVRGNPEVLGDPGAEPHVVVGEVEEVPGDQEAAVPQDVVEVPEDEEFSLEVLVLIALVTFGSIAALLSFPFGGLRFRYRFGTWATIFSALWITLVIWWIRNNGDRHLLYRVLRQIRGT